MTAMKLPQFIETIASFVIYKAQRSYKTRHRANRGMVPMRVEKEIRFNEWLLGSTILCQSCGCLWLVPAAQKQDSYVCRQCGSQVTGKPAPMTVEQSTKRSSN